MVQNLALYNVFLTQKIPLTQYFVVLSIKDLLRTKILDMCGQTDTKFLDICGQTDTLKGTNRQKGERKKEEEK